MHNKKKDNESIFKVDTIEKANELLNLMQFRSRERVRVLLLLFPETKKCTHEYIAWLCGLSRETVTKAICKMERKQYD